MMLEIIAASLQFILYAIVLAYWYVYYMYENEDDERKLKKRAAILTSIVFIFILSVSAGIYALNENNKRFLAKIEHMRI